MNHNANSWYPKFCIYRNDDWQRHIEKILKQREIVASCKKEFRDSAAATNRAHDRRHERTRANLIAAETELRIMNVV